MTESFEYAEPRAARIKTVMGWGAAVLLVIAAWAIALDLRGSGTGEVVPMDGWVEGIEAGQQVAEQQDRPMLLMFTADWCGPCQQVKKNVLSLDAVKAELAESFVPVKIDLTSQSRDNPNAAVAQQYRVRSIPYFVVVDRDGRMVSGLQAHAQTSVGEFMGWLGKSEIEAGGSRAAAR